MLHFTDYITFKVTEVESTVAYDALDYIYTVVVNGASNNFEELHEAAEFVSQQMPTRWNAEDIKTIMLANIQQDYIMKESKPLTQAQRLRMIKKAHKNVQKKTKLQDRIALQDTRALTKSVKKAGQHAPKNLDAFSEQNMYYSDREVDDFIKGSTMYENYQSMQDDY